MEEKSIDTVFDFIGPAPSGDRGQDTAEGFLVRIGETRRLDVIAPFDGILQIDESDIVGHLTRQVIGMQDNAVDGHCARLLGCSLFEAVLPHADLELRRPPTVTTKWFVYIFVYIFPPPP